MLEKNISIIFIKKLNLVSIWKGQNCFILTKIGNKLNKNNEYKDWIV